MEKSYLKCGELDQLTAQKVVSFLFKIWPPKDPENFNLKKKTEQYLEKKSDHDLILYEQIREKL